MSFEEPLHQTPVAYPPAPSDGPRVPSIYSASKVLSAARSIAMMATKKASFNAVGLPRDAAHEIRKRADEGSDPFWTWAAEVMDIAEAQPRIFAARSLHEQIAHGNTNATKFYLERMTEDYSPPERRSEISVNGTVQHGHIHAHLEELLKGALPGPTVLEGDAPALEGPVSGGVAGIMAAVQKATEEAEPDLANTDKFIEAEPHPAFRIQKPEDDDAS